jgi:hypothetical protein
MSCNFVTSSFCKWKAMSIDYLNASKFLSYWNKSYYDSKNVWLSLPQLRNEILLLD